MPMCKCISWHLIHLCGPLIGLTCSCMSNHCHKSQHEFVLRLVLTLFLSIPFRVQYLAEEEWYIPQLLRAKLYFRKIKRKPNRRAGKTWAKRYGGGAHNVDLHLEEYYWRSIPGPVRRFASDYPYCIPGYYVRELHCLAGAKRDAPFWQATTNPR